MRRLVLSVLAISFIVFSTAAFTQQTNAAQDQHGARSTTSPKLDDSMQDMQGMQHDSVDKKSENIYRRDSASRHGRHIGTAKLDK